MFASGRESGPRHVWRLPGKGDRQEDGQEGRQDMGRERGRLENCPRLIWEEAGEEVACGGCSGRPRDEGRADGSDRGEWFPHSDLRVRPGAKSQCGQCPEATEPLAKLRFLTDRLLSASHVPWHLQEPRVL